MHIICDIKNKIASESAGFGFWQPKLFGGAQLQCIYYLVLYTDLKAAEGN